MKHTIPGILRTAAAMLLFFAVAAGGVYAQNAPTRDTYEFKNRIVDEDGQAIPDGTYNMKFILFNQAGGGTELWSEARTVATRRGNFSVDLGSLNPLPKNVLGETANLYLHICLDFNGADGDGSGICATRYEENFRSRKRITSVPWALRSFALGPVSINEGGVGFPINVTGGNGTITSFRYLGGDRLSIGTDGTTTFSNGTNSFNINPGSQRINLTGGADIFFGSSSLKSTGAGVSGATIIGVNQANFTNISGANVQQVLDSIDDAIGGGGGGGGPETDPVWIAEKASATSITGAWTFSAAPTFSQGVVLGNNSGTAAGTIRYTGTDFEGYNGSSWLSLTGGGGGGPESDPVWSADRDSDPTTVGADWTFISPLTTDDLIPASDDSAVIGQDGSRYSEGRFSNFVGIGTDANFAGDAALHIDSRGTAAVSGGNNYPVRISTEYDPTGLAGTENFNNIYITSTVNAGDGTTLNRQRGVRTELTNNSTGPLNGIYSSSHSAWNNGPINGSLYSYSGFVQNNDSVTGFINSVGTTVENNGTAVNLRSFESLMNNNGDNSSAIGLHIIANNTGSNAGGFSGEILTINNQASGITNNLYGEGITVTNNGEVTGRGHVGWYGFHNHGTFSDVDHVFYEFNAVNHATGSLPQWYGWSNIQRNDGEARGGWLNMRNQIWVGSTGTHSGGIDVLGNMVLNEGSITGDVFTVNNTTAFGSTSGNVYGTRNTVGSNHLLESFPHAATNVYGTVNEVIASGGQEITASNTLTGLRNEIYGPVSAGTTMYGIYNNIIPDGTASEFAGIYNFIDPSAAGDPSDYYGMYSSNGISEVWLNYQGTPGTNYSIFGGPAYFETVDINGEENRLANTPGSAATADLYYGNDLLCDVSEPNCGSGGGGGGSLWTDDGFGNIYYDTGGVGIGAQSPYGEGLYIEGDGNIGLSVYNGSVGLEGPVGIGSTTYNGFNNEMLYIERPNSSAHIRFQDGGWGDPFSPDEGSLWWNGSELNFYDGSTTTDLLAGGGGGGGFWTESCCGDIYYESGYVSIGTSSTNELFTLSGGFYQGGDSVAFLDEDIYLLDYDGFYFGQNSQTDSYFYGNMYLNNTYFEWDFGDVYFDSGNELVFGNNGTPSYFYGTVEHYGQTYFYDGINLSTGDMYVSSGNLSVENGYLCVDDGTYSCPASTAGTIYGQYAYSEFDIAENIHARQGVEAGDIVMPDSDSPESVRKSDRAYAHNVLGVISTDPGVRGGVNLEEKSGYSVQPISLAGRVPVKVNNQNGSIAIGDPITTSDTPGVGMKATNSGRIIGFALEAFDGSEGQIIVFLNATHYAAENDNNGTRAVAGKAILNAGEIAVTIEDTNVRADSVIILTPTSSTQGQFPYVLSQTDGSFTVRIDSAVERDISMNYMVN
ncbi:MAG: hypothetical protein TR69_WS6001000563 [candidate division WS6 bacterium OLB20]|uniref:Uncharacterized protein n=1 Tax=candidate division WS6 bacterium OLB20 TaxID=1617426 RepID=A0A136LY85_9BACT|nr:MAG: hypothetical protein TR69_WS6001000563 [candidate division WS6 bacterium OLB20]